MRSAVSAIYPRSDGLPGIADCDLNGFLARFQREASFTLWLGVVLGALVFHLTPIFTVLVPLPAAFLPARLLDRHAHAITSSNLYLVRQAMLVLKLPAGLCWGAHADVRRCFALPPLPPDPDDWRTE